VSSRLPTHFARLNIAGGAALALAGLLSPLPALAAGFDTPILYTARHQAMGGTAIASVSDASAGFHNPAGLQGVRGLGFIGDFSMILGKVRATPDADFSGNLESDTVIAPFFLLGGAYRVHEWVTLGLSAFPVASGGAEYHYNAGASAWIDKTEIVFFEATPMASLNVPKDRLLPGKLSFGAGYRFSYVTFDREKGPENNPVFLNLKLKGTNWSGFRVGAQYRPIDMLAVGVVFRNKVVVETEADEVTVATQKVTDTTLDFTLPAKLGFGVRFDWKRLGLASDVEWALQSQNKAPPLEGTLMGEKQQVPNVFDWQNGVTWRVGAEYRLGDRPQFPIRLGYIYDSQVTNRSYPSAFGTPPAPTHTLTAGAGFVQPTWQVNVAATRRMGSTTIDETDPEGRCEFCGFPGKYSIRMTGIYVDASVDLPM
jgi:long-subunit fatty acid transport protein